MDLSAKDDSIVVVTGASGFVGSYVIKLLLEQGYKVRGTVRNAKDEKKVKFLREMVPSAKYPLELFSADLTTPGSSVVFHEALMSKDPTTRLFLEQHMSFIRQPL